MGPLDVPGCFWGRVSGRSMKPGLRLGAVASAQAVPAVLPEGDPAPVRQLPRQAHPQGLPGQVQPQEDEEVRTGSCPLGQPLGRTVGAWPLPSVPARPRVPRRLEKEYAAIKNKEMEEQIEIKVSWGRAAAAWGPSAHPRPRLGCPGALGAIPGATCPTLSRPGATDPLLGAIESAPGAALSHPGALGAVPGAIAATLGQP